MYIYFYKIITSSNQRLLTSLCLHQKTARVVVGGKQSAPVTLADMVYQGTVWGPVLWNVF